MQKIRARLLPLLLVLAMLAGIFPMTALAAADDDVTIYMSFEGYTLGHGFFVEPTRLTLPAGSTGEDATRKLLTQAGLTYDYSTAWGFFLNRVFGLDAGDANPPDFIMDAIAEGEDWEGNPFVFDSAGSADGSLGSGDHLGVSGWMVTVNHQTPPVGMDGHMLADGDVIRWQFSLLMGDDLGIQEEWNAPLYEHADKSDLIRALFAAGLPDSKLQVALAVIINPLATAADAANALAVLTWTNSFADIAAEDWFFEAVWWANARELMAGVGEGQFAPTMTFSRAMVAALLWNVAGQPQVTGSAAFDDVAAGQWYSNAIAWASASGLVQGFGDGRFGPHEPITREQLAVFFRNYAAYLGHNTNGGVFSSDFADENLISSWALEALQWANTVGLIGGRTPTTIVPQGTAMRAETARLLQLFFELVLETPGITPGVAIADAAAFLLQVVPNPGMGAVGGDWLVLGLARSGLPVPEAFFDDYFSAVERHITDRNGVLDERILSEYSRVILGLTAAGFDPCDVAGVDLTAPLGDFERVIWQGINGAIFALLALDSLDFPIQQAQEAYTQATRELFVQEILRRQTPDGGWNMTAGMPGLIGQNEQGDADVTGMALQALAKYQDMPEVYAATERALAFLTEIQREDGGFASAFSPEESSVESAVQVLVALTELGICINDPRFAPNGNTLADNILSFRNADGGFRQTRTRPETRLISTEQALYALVAAQRAQDGRNSLYRMDDAGRRGVG